MKKVVMLFAVAVCAAGLHAASVAWNVSNIFEPGSTVNKAAIGAVTCYLVDNSVVSSSEMSSYLGGDSADKMSYLSSSSVASAANNALGKLSTTVSIDKADGNYGFYTVIVNGEQAVVGDIVTATITSVGTPTMGSFNAKTLTQSSNSWKSVSGGGGDVPEPTSGLLLLLGGAMLALRRKQK